MPGFVISAIILSLIVLGFIPAMIASGKGYRFPGWYVYGVILFPVALIHSLLVKKPVFLMNVYSFTDDGKRKKKSYRAKINKTERQITFKYICMVFFAKLIFSILAGIVVYAIIRTYNINTMSCHY